MTNWSGALRQAEALVSYSSSFLSVRSLLSDEFASVAMAARKLIASRHPLIKTARGLLSKPDEGGIRTRGLCLLLLARSVNSTLAESAVQQAAFYNQDILQSQRSLAEISEIIYTAFEIHEGILNVEDMADSPEMKNLNLGNKIAVLGGDYLLANASTALAKLYNPKVTNLIAMGIEDMSLAGMNDPNHSTWEQTVSKRHGSLMGFASESMLALAVSEATNHETTDVVPSKLIHQLATDISMALSCVEYMRDSKAGKTSEGGDEADDHDASENKGIRMGLVDGPLAAKFSSSDANELCHVTADSALGILKEQLVANESSQSLVELLACITAESKALLDT